MLKRLRRMSTLMLMIWMFVICTVVAHADYPIFYQRYTADPTVIEYDGRLYMYASHDVYDRNNPTYIMKDITCISTDDLKNWTDHGEVFEATGTWANLTWAPSMVCRNDKFYLYYGNAGSNIGVAVSDSPTGPFVDPLGKPLVDGNTPGINAPSTFWCFDPCVFVDDDGQAYMYFGGNGEGNTRVIKLKDNMIEVDGAASQIMAPAFFEASFMHKYNGKYYFSYSSDYSKGLPSIDYMMSDNPMTGFEYKGTVLPNPPDNAYDNNHHSIFSYKGEWYIAYHNKGLALLNNEPAGAAITFQRSVGLDRLYYNEDGTIQETNVTKDGLAQLKNVNPYVKNEAETMAEGRGINTEANANSSRSVNMIENGDWIRVSGVDFGDGAGTFMANVASGYEGGSIELRLDSAEGTLIGTLPVSYTGDEHAYREKLCSISGAEGVHDLYFVFKGSNAENLFMVDYWKFSEKKNEKQLEGINALIENSKIDVAEDNNITKLTVMAVYTDGTSSDVTSEAVASAEQNGIVSISDGLVTGIGYGETVINVNYGGKTDTANILVKNLDDELTATQISVDKNNLSMISGTTETYTVTAKFADGHTEDVTDKAICTNSNAEVVFAENGIITAVSKGNAGITVSYKGRKGDAVTTQIAVEVSNNNPYIRNEAEDYQEENGIQIEDCAEGGKQIGYVENGDWIKFNGVDFSAGTSNFEVRVASATSGGVLEIRLDNPDGTLVGTVSVSGTGGWGNWVSNSCKVSNITGVHDLYLKFVGGEGYLFNVNWWQFSFGRDLPGIACSGGNPIINTDFYADPSCRVFDGKMYVYGSHDIDNNEGYNMRDYRVWSSEDGVTWTNTGVALDKTDVAWVAQEQNTMWAPDCVYNNGTYYLFFPAKDKNGTDRIGVAKAETPEGPFKAEENYIEGITGIDPCVYIDDESGDAYIYWSTNCLPYEIKVSKLTSDLLSLETTPSTVVIEGIQPYYLIEGPWVHKYNGNLYMSFPVCYSGEYSEVMDYAMGISPMGPFVYKGRIFDSNSIFTVHGSFVNYKDKWYVFYHDTGINGNHYGRMWCAEEFIYNEDGTIPKLRKTLRGIGEANAYNKVQIDRYNECSDGVKNNIIYDDAPDEWEWAVGYINDGDYVKYSRVDFTNESPKSVSARVASLYGGATIEIHKGSEDGEIIGFIPVPATGSFETYTTVKANLIADVTGVQDLVFVFRKGEVNVNWIQFDKTPIAAEHILVGIDASIDKKKLDIIPGKNEANIKIIAIYEDGICEDITNAVSVITDEEGLVDISNGVITAKGYGDVNIEMSYGEKTDVLKLIVKDLDTEVIAKKLIVDKSNITLLNGGSDSYSVTVEFADGHTEDVTDKCSISASDIADIKNGVITARNKGTDIITLSYKGEKGDEVTTQLIINVVNVNPYTVNEAERYQTQSGIKIEDCNEGGSQIGYAENGDWIKYSCVDFDKGAVSFEARVASETAGGKVELRLDSPDGQLIGTLNVAGTGSWQNWVTESCSVSNVYGMHDLYLKFSGENGYLFNLNWWKFSSAEIKAEIVNATIEDNILNLSVDITNALEGNVQGKVIMVLYDDNAMADVKLYDLNVEGNNTVTVNSDFTLPENIEGYNMKVFVWNNLTQLMPLAKPCGYSLN